LAAAAPTALGVRLSTGTSSSLTLEPQATSAADKVTAEKIEKKKRFMKYLA
jgi:hypothetical protein